MRLFKRICKRAARRRYGDLSRLSTPRVLSLFRSPAERRFFTRYGLLFELMGREDV